MWGRRLCNGAGVAVIAGVLVFAVPISADAFVAPVPLGQFVLGAVRAAAPAIAGSSVVGPEGTLIATTVVAVGAVGYATRDTWMPWVKGLFGQGGSTSEQVTVATYVLDPPVVDPSPEGIASVHGVQTGAGQMLDIDVSYQCKSLGGIYTTGLMGRYLEWPGLGGEHTWTGQCQSGGVMTELHSIDANGHVANQVAWGAAFDPYNDATYRVDMTCRKADGSTAIISATTVSPGNPATPVEGPAGGGLLVPSCAEQFPESHGEGLTVNGGQNGSPMHELSRQLFPTTSTEYPNCVGAGVACTYVVTYNGVPCVVGQAECVDWTRKRLLDEDAYGCLFGPYTMTLAQCAVDERVYEPGGVVLTQANTDGNPNTYDYPAPSGSPQPIPPGAPGGAPAPLPVPQIEPSPTQTNNTDCWPSGTAAWNPAEWVLTPVKCALTWAFVPRAAMLTTLSSAVGADFARVGIAPIAAGVGSNVGLVGSGSGCDGPQVTFDAVGVNKVMHPFSACVAPMSTVAGISRALSTLAIIGIGGFSALRAVGAGFGFNVSMGRGKDSEA